MSELGIFYPTIPEGGGVEVETFEGTVSSPFGANVPLESLDKIAEGKGCAEMTLTISNKTYKLSLVAQIYSGQNTLTYDFNHYWLTSGGDNFVMWVGYIRQKSEQATHPWNSRGTLYYQLNDENGDPYITDLTARITNSTPVTVTITTWD